ncbi:MAG: molybdopterin molybdotransferase MoeA [Thermodesulfobacteriota bacterium]|nr:molybdopterin molybdotransferase MoeA [Thermodesulfobacteriota bacterium]
MLLPISDAINLIFSNVKEAGEEELLIEETSGRVIAEDVESKIEMPPFNKSAMDGYAVKTSDTPGKLMLTEVVPAGIIPEKKLNKGETTLVMTGAPVPEGTEAVVMREQTIEGRDYIEIQKKAIKGENIAFKGEDIKKGERLLEKGEIITPGKVSLLATLGYRRVKVKKIPEASLIVTGNELCEPGSIELPRGFIYNSNAYSLMAQYKELGGKINYIGIIEDNIENLVDSLSKAEKANIILISGGVSKGDYDYVEESIKQWGGKIIFHYVAIKPGKPFLFAKKKDVLVFGMPGNPVSTLVIFWKFIGPAVLKMQGAKELFPEKIPAFFKGNYSKKKDRPHYIGVKLIKSGNILTAEYIPSHGSADVPSFCMADGIIEIPQEIKAIKDGDLVEVRLIHPPFRYYER